MGRNYRTPEQIFKDHKGAIDEIRRAALEAPTTMKKSGIVNKYNVRHEIFDVLADVGMIKCTKLGHTFRIELLKREEPTTKFVEDVIAKLRAYKAGFTKGMKVDEIKKSIATRPKPEKKFAGKIITHEVLGVFDHMTMDHPITVVVDHVVEILNVVKLIFKIDKKHNALTVRLISQVEVIGEKIEVEIVKIPLKPKHTIALGRRGPDDKILLIETVPV